MASWPDAWPAEVRRYYDAWACDHRWTSTMVEAVAASVEQIRELAGSGRPRQHFHAHADAAAWFFETVSVQDEHVVIRQVIIDDAGGTQRYSWDHLLDADGELTDVALELDHVQRIRPGAFAEAWGRAG